MLLKKIVLWGFPDSMIAREELMRTITTTLTTEAATVGSGSDSGPLCNPVALAGDIHSSPGVHGKISQR